MQVGRVVFDAVQRKGFGRPVSDCHHAVDHSRIGYAHRRYSRGATRIIIQGSSRCSGAHVVKKHSNLRKAG